MIEIDRHMQNRSILRKTEYVRSRKYLNAAEDSFCVRCSSEVRPAVACHYTGLRQHDYGKGRGVKCHDICTADLCDECHGYFDRPEINKSIEASEEFLHYIMLTIIRRVQNGIIKL